MTAGVDDLGGNGRAGDVRTHEVRAGDVHPGDAAPFRRPWRERLRISRMIGRWPEGLRFEDAVVPREGFFRGCARDVPGIWPESSLSLDAGIARKR
jgi:hypothetical protein